MPPRHRLDVAWTWNGARAAASERACVELALHADRLSLRVAAPFHGDPPPRHPVGPTPGLWEHEVVELFVASAGEPWRYTEVELSPWGHHLVLQLDGVRRVAASELPLRFRVRRAGTRWSGAARLPLTRLPPLPWRVAAFAIHGTGASRRHLASTPLPGPRPDFHQPERFPLLRSLTAAPAAPPMERSLQATSDPSGPRGRNDEEVP